MKARTKETSLKDHIARLQIAQMPNLDCLHHGIQPVEYKVVIRPMQDSGEIEFKNGFKLLKPDDVKERDQHAAIEGAIVAVSPLAFTYEQWPEGARKPQVGDTAIFARYSGNTIKGNDGVEYRIMNDKDVIAIREAAR